LGKKGQDEGGKLPKVALSRSLETQIDVFLFTCREAMTNFCRAVSRGKKSVWVCHALSFSKGVGLWLKIISFVV
jgi:hypothetical protein